VGPYDLTSCVNMGAEGLYILQSRQYKWRMETFWKIHFVDTTMNLKDPIEFKFADSLRLVTNTSHRGDPYFLFSNFSRSRIEVVRFNNPSGERTLYEIYLPFNFVLGKFLVTDRSFLFAGYEKDIPVVLYYNIATKKIKVVPGLYNEGTSLLQVAANNDSSFEVFLLLPTTAKQTGIQVIGYSEEGALKYETRIEPSDKHLISCQSIPLNSEEVMIKGTWSMDRSGYSNGIFVGRIDSNGSQKITYYNYSDFDSFFIYKSDNAQERVKKRIENNQVKGKDVRVSYQMLVNDPFQKDDKTIMVGQVYKPAYGNSYAGRYRYTHAVVLIFDEKGALISDASVDLPDIVTMELKQVAFTSVQKDSLTFLYLLDDDIQVKTESLSIGTSKLETVPIRLLHSGDKQREFLETYSGFEKWYEDTFFVYGIQNITNKEKKDLERRRKVFFLNKITL